MYLFRPKEKIVACAASCMSANEKKNNNSSFGICLVFLKFLKHRFSILTKQNKRELLNYTAQKNKSHTKSNVMYKIWIWYNKNFTLTVDCDQL